MKLVSALVGVAALCGVALSGATASAMPVTIPGQASQASNVVQAGYVCNPWHCWHRSFYSDGYSHPTTMAVGAGIVAGDMVGTAGIIGTTGTIGEFERGFGPFLIGGTKSK